MKKLSLFALGAAFCIASIPAIARSRYAIEIVQPWARATPNGAQTGAVYLTIKNLSRINDRLESATSPVAQKAQIHQMTVANGIMRMREVAGGLSAPAGGTVALKPGGYHIMLIGLKKPLKVGDRFPLTLDFKTAGEIRVSIPVRPIGAMSAGHGKTNMQKMKSGMK